MRITIIGLSLVVLASASYLVGCNSPTPAAQEFVVKAPAPPPIEQSPAKRTYDYSHSVIKSEAKHTNQHWPVALLRFTDTTEIEGIPFGKKKEPTSQAGDSEVKVEIKIGSDNKTDIGELIERQRNENQFSKRSREILKHELVRTRAYTVIERERIEEIIREVKFGETDSVDAQTAPEKGKLMCARYILEGSLGLNEDMTLKGELMDRPTPPPIESSGWGKLARGKQQERLRQMEEFRRQRLQRNKKLREKRIACYISAYATHTGEVKTSVVGLGINRLEAIQDAVNELTIALSEVDDGIRVAGVSGNKIFLDIGSNGDVEVGQRLQLVHLGDEIRNHNGIVIGQDESEVAEVEIIEVREMMSVARLVTEGATVQQGDLARPAQH